MKKFMNFVFVLIVLVSSGIVASCDKKDIIAFKSCVLNNEGNYELIVDNNVESFSFLDEIIIDKAYSYFISKDDYGLNTYQTKIVPLSVGENKFYIFVLDSEGRTKEKLNISITRLDPVYMLTGLHNEISLLDTFGLPGQSFDFNFEIRCEDEYLVKIKTLYCDEVSSFVTGNINDMYLINEWIDSSLLTNRVNHVYIRCSTNFTNSESGKLLVSLQYSIKNNAA